MFRSARNDGFATWVVCFFSSLVQLLRSDPAGCIFGILVYMPNVSIRSVLWDIPEQEIGAVDISFIVRRILCYGSVFLLFQAISQYGKELFEQEFSKLKKTSMDARRYHYLRTYVFSE